MILTIDEIALLKANSKKISDAREIAEKAKADCSMNGVFPKGQTEDFSSPDLVCFRNEWSDNWEVNELLLRIAILFLEQKPASAVNSLIELGKKLKLNRTEL